MGLEWIVVIEVLTASFVRFQVGERIRVILDCDDNTLAFERNYEFLGVAFRGKQHMKVLKKVYLCKEMA